MPLVKNPGTHEMEGLETERPLEPRLSKMLLMYVWFLLDFSFLGLRKLKAVWRGKLSRHRPFSTHLTAFHSINTNLHQAPGVLCWCE